jgi:serine/threonine-protein kinase RsbW
MSGQPGQPKKPASFVFETHKPVEERTLLFRRFRAFAHKQSWTNEITNEVDLILEEWIADVIKYGVISVPAPFFRVELSWRDDLARIVVTDNGLAFDPTKHPEPNLNLPPEKRPIGGLGIFMMRKLSSSMHYKRQQGLNILTIEKDLARPCLSSREPE